MTKRPKVPALADPEPAIIRMLRVMRWRSTLSAAEVAQADAYIESIIQAWIAREDPEELKTLLGLKPSKKRRKQKTVDEQSTMALQWLALVLKGQTGSDAKEAIAARLNVELRTVERAIAGWRESLEEAICNFSEDQRQTAVAELAKVRRTSDTN